jgi:hypothetical protein
MRPVICAKLLARSIRVVLDYLRTGPAAGRYFCGSKAISQFLQDFNFSCTQRLHQSDALFESYLETSSK